MNSNEKWYVRNTKGKVFGPIDFETLKKWVRDGRVEPLAGISKDLQNWKLAPLKPELEMEWIIENNPGQFYGPTHRAVVDDFLKSGTLSPGARFYYDNSDLALDGNSSVCSIVEELTATRENLESTKAELDKANTELDKVHAELDKANAERAEKEAEAAEAINALNSLKAELDKLKAEREAIHAREWKTEVLVPEVVVSDEPPPPIARMAFNPSTSSLAALEKQAQAELARMGAKSFFAFGKNKKS